MAKIVPRPRRDRFTGQIAGVGTTSGVRLVVGHWADGPWGPFADVMLETPDEHRVLLAPDQRVADFVASTYSFDEVRLEPVRVEETDARLVVTADSLDLTIRTGERTALGHLLRLVPTRVATAPAWCAVTDPVARTLLRGVRTRGSAGGGRREFYGATDIRSVHSASGHWQGQDLGSLAPVDPPCHFGFSSVPIRPSVTRLVTTVTRPQAEP